MKGEICQMNCRKPEFVLKLRRKWRFFDRIHFNPALRVLLLPLERQLLFTAYFASPFKVQSSTMMFRHVICAGSSLLRPSTG